MKTLLSAEELMAGSDLTFDVELPAFLLNPQATEGDNAPSGRCVRLRPLTVRDIQLIAKAARDDDVLTSILMIQRAVVEPAFKQQEVAQMSGGLVRFLVESINHVSGLSSSADELRDMTQAPLVQAFFVLARDFHWTPEQVRALTVGQLLGYLELLQSGRQGVTA